MHIAIVIIPCKVVKCFALAILSFITSFKLLQNQAFSAMSFYNVLNTSCQNSITQLVATPFQHSSAMFLLAVCSLLMSLNIQLILILKLFQEQKRSFVLSLHILSNRFVKQSFIKVQIQLKALPLIKDTAYKTFCNLL